MLDEVRENQKSPSDGVEGAIINVQKQAKTKRKMANFMKQWRSSICRAKFDLKRIANELAHFSGFIKHLHSSPSELWLVLASWLIYLHLLWPPLRHCGRVQHRQDFHSLQFLSHKSFHRQGKQSVFHPSISFPSRISRDNKKCCHSTIWNTTTEIIKKRCEKYRQMTN